MVCGSTILHVCLTEARDAAPAVFAFPDFLTALALLALAFSSSDERYRFKIEIAPLPLRRLAFLMSLAVGGGSLLTDLWFANNWLSLPWGWRRSTIQASLAVAFIGMIFTWLWFAFLAPTTFSRMNYRRFLGAVYWRLIRGSESQLAVLTEQIPQAAAALIRLSAPRPEYVARSGAEGEGNPSVHDFAHDTLWLLGNRKFCRSLMANAPHTAIALVQEAKRQGRNDIPLGMFMQNVTLEAILNVDSQIYHEDTSSLTSVFSYWQPFTTELYGSYELLETLAEGRNGAFDFDWPAYDDFTSLQWEAYCRLVLTTLRAFSTTRSIATRSQVLNGALDRIKSITSDVYKVNGLKDAYATDTLKKVYVTMDFVRSALKILDECGDVSGISLRLGSDGRDYYKRAITDDLAAILYRVILDATAVEGPPDLAWSLYYNAIWTNFLWRGGEGKATSIVLFKLRRLLYDEIKHMEEFPNFEGARILGFCLNVMPFGKRVESRSGQEMYPLEKAVTEWARRNYMILREANVRVADACLIGRVTYDAESTSLVQTYAQGLRSEPPRAYLKLMTIEQEEAAPRGITGVLFALWCRIGKSRRGEVAGT